MENLWKEKLMSQGWSPSAAGKMIRNWAPSTINSYQAIIDKLQLFCAEVDTEFPCISSATLADFLCHTAEKSTRPKSVLNSTLAAISMLNDVLQRQDCPISPAIAKLVSALIKSETTEPMKRSKVMPVGRFHDLFLQWEGNWKISIENLCMKCITLLALAMMLRPSDIAPKAVVREGEDSYKKFVMSTDQVHFNPDGSATITLFGIKNDYSREGFEVIVQPASVVRLDPVATLRTYIDRTRSIRPKNKALFISLRKPHTALSSATIARILDRAISMAGLGGQGFSAKSFRPTGASHAVEQGLQPDTIRKVGRWKSQETFESHYVHSRPAVYFTDKILGVQTSSEIRNTTQRHESV